MVTTLHPANLSGQDIERMDRLELVEQIVVHEAYSMFKFDRDFLAQLDDEQLRKLLDSLRYHFHQRGY